MKTNVEVLKNSGEVQAFSEEKLKETLKHTCLSHESCSQVIDEVSKDLSASISSNEIFQKTAKLVQKKSRLAAVQYSLKRSLFDLGPEGHHFEIYVSKYFQELGFETIECVTLQGKYVTHEVDVIAVKGKEKLYVECKFHNHLGVKNDIKVALYVKARWDDLKEGPDGKSISGYCLASNTSFTSDALKYGKGTGLKLLGVNAPPSKSFLDQVIELKLYPVTSLTSIDKMIKREALAKKIVLAKDLLNEKDFLAKLGCDEIKLKEICDEICFLTKDSCEDSILGCH